MSDLFTEDAKNGYYIWLKCRTPYPVWEGKHLVAIYTVKSERDRMFVACQKHEEELKAACQLLEDTPLSADRAGPSSKREKLISKIQKSCGIYDS